MIIVPVEKMIDWRRPPLVLITLVALNVLIFAFYQGDDTEVMIEAVEHYYDNDMMELEWPAYRKYLQRADLPVEFGKDDEGAAFYIISDIGFDRFMAEQGERYIRRSKVIQWRESRQQLESISNRISSKALGFHTNEASTLSLFTSQFLHGGAMHLISNMVFLILVGFAVEAALGSAVFLIYYLLSGVGAAMLFAGFASTSGTLIGASGSISGVMAMYVVLFGMRKIQFFYWVFIFTGYLRAAAIIMLPVYILKELYSYFTLEGSNVAFTAHIGGFVCGALLVWLTKEYRSQSIDKDYLDNDSEDVDQDAIDLQRVYDLMGQCEFSQAWDLLKPIKQKNANHAQIIELEFNLVRALHPSKLSNYLVHRMDKSGNSDALIGAQLREWQIFNNEQRYQLAAEKKSSLLLSALEVRALEVAEQVFESLRSETEDPMLIAVSARQIGSYCSQNNLQDKSKKYNELARKLADHTHESPAEGLS